MATLVVADDHPLFRSALMHAIRSGWHAISEDQTLQLIEAGDLDSTGLALQQNPDCELLLLDLHMPGSGGFLGLIQLRQQHPELPIVVVSASEEHDVIRRVINFGAAAYIPKSASPTQINQALAAVLAGGVWVPESLPATLFDNSDSAADEDLAARVAQLTQQQHKVLYYLAEGWLNKQIAHDLGISEATVKAHLTAIFRKLDCSNRTQAAIMAQRLTLEAPVDKALSSEPH